jgi:ribonuclease HI
MTLPKPHAVLYADGACSGNPGPGGWAFILRAGETRIEKSGGFRRTTNNRMEITAVLEGLRALKEVSRVDVHTDSQYVVNAMNQGWAVRWQAQGWKRNKKEKALNPDLWEELLDLCDRHDAAFHWTKGHAGDPDNERCDRLSKKALSAPGLPEDPGFEREESGGTLNLFD